MQIQTLSLENFRNYQSAELYLNPGINLFLGRNGQGKTNLLEAIHYPTIFGSHRTATQQALIRSGTESAILRFQILSNERALQLDCQINSRGGNKIQLQHKPVQMKDISRFYHSVLFAPEDLIIIRGEPAYRRKFIDEILVQRLPRFFEILQDYQRTLKQRNTLLKSLRKQSSSARETLAVWTEKLVSLGSQIIVGRFDTLRALLPHVKNQYQFLVENDHAPLLDMSISFEDNQNITDLMSLLQWDGDLSSFNYAIEQRFMNNIQKVLDEEIDRGISLMGPHRDDIFFGLNDLPVKGYASHGETWSFALSLRLAEAALVKQHSLSGDPVILLDDVFAELDRFRQQKLAEAIVQYEQVVISAAVAEDIPENLEAAVQYISAGKIVEKFV